MRMARTLQRIFQFGQIINHRQKREDAIKTYFSIEEMSVLP